MYFHVNKITSFEIKLMITIDMVNRLTKNLFLPFDHPFLSTERARGHCYK